MADPLSTCLAELFTAKELEWWMNEHYPQLVLNVSFDGARQQVAFDVVQALKRNVGIDQDVLRRLIAARPLKEAKIHQAFDDAHAAHHRAVSRPSQPSGGAQHPSPQVATATKSALNEAIRSRLIRTLADLDIFYDARALRPMVRTALSGVDRGHNFLRTARFDGRPLDVARALVVQTERLGTPPGDFLVRILKELWDDAVNDEQLLVLTAALEQLESAANRPADIATSDHSSAEFDAQLPRPRRADQPHRDGPMVMISYRLVDIDQVRPWIHELRARGVNAVWDQDQPNDSDIPVWVWATYQRADWIVLACSEAYDRAVKDLLRAPNKVPEFGKGVAQEARFMATEHLNRGPGRFVPVLLPDSRPEHVPLVAKGKLHYTLPAQLAQLAQHLQYPRQTQPGNNNNNRRHPRAAQPEEDDDQAQASSAPSALDVARQRQIKTWKNASDKRHERFIELDLMPTVDGPMQPQTFTSLEALMNAVEEPAVLLVGDPGAGKTTLLQHLRFELAQADLDGNSD